LKAKPYCNLPKDLNVLQIIGRVESKLRQEGLNKQADEFFDHATQTVGKKELLDVVKKYVHIII
jgi:hypothetical protein